jgi:hypothetical protein
VNASELAGHRLWQLRRARRGAALSRRRLLDALDAAPIVTESAMGPVRDQTWLHAWTIEHDVSYYAWEAVKIVNIARKVRGDHRVQAALDAIEESAPGLSDFRDAITHPEDNRTADDVLFAAAAMRLQPGLQPEYIVDPRYGLHDALEALVSAAEASLLAIAGPDESAFPRFDNSGRDLV